MHGGVLSAAFTERRDADFYNTDVCPEASLYLVSAVIALAFQPFHIALSLLSFHYFRQRTASPPLSTIGFYFRMFSVFGLHLLAALASSLNTKEKGCRFGVPLTVLVVALTCGYASFRVTRSSYISAIVAA